MEPEGELNHTRLARAYLRLAEESKKVIRESPGAVAVRGEPPKPARKPKKKEQPAEQLRMF